MRKRGRSFWFRTANQPTNELAKLTDNEPKTRSDSYLKPLLNIGFKNTIISLTSNIYTRAQSELNYSRTSPLKHLERQPDLKSQPESKPDGRFSLHRDDSNPHS